MPDPTKEVPIRSSTKGQISRGAAPDVSPDVNGRRRKQRLIRPAIAALTPPADPNHPYPDVDPRKQPAPPDSEQGPIQRAAPPEPESDTETSATAVNVEVVVEENLRLRAENQRLREMSMQEPLPSYPGSARASIALQMTDS